MNREEFLGGRVVLHHGDSRDVLKTLPDNSIDSVCTDPPYALVSIVKRFGGNNAAPAVGNDAYARASAGFMGKTWDTGETAFAVEFWAEVLRVLKPGGWLIAASGTRTYHRLACAIEDAGFEIRDMVSWLYGSGFPKSAPVAKHLDRLLGGEGTYGAPKSAAHAGWIERGAMRGDDGHEGYQRPWMQDEQAVENAARVYLPATEIAQAHAGSGTALKPACEPWVLARKPLIGTIAANIVAHGTGALNIDACRVQYETDADRRDETRGKHEAAAGYDGLAGGSAFGGLPASRTITPAHDLGRWPSNVIVDDSDEVAAAFGDVLRFFYSAKADAMDRLGTKHPTVKPVDLMQYFARLITPPGGLVLDPFAGSGTTGEAAWREGFRAILIERESEYVADIAERLRLASAGEHTRRRASGRGKAKPIEEMGGLFA